MTSNSIITQPIRLLLCSIIMITVTNTIQAETSSTVHFSIDTTIRGKIIGNKVSTVNVWQLQGFCPHRDNEGADLSGFVEYVQFMQATGGNVSRDLFIDPTNCTVTNDYDFSSLVNACRVVLELGAKPHIKLSVPDKLSYDSAIGIFGVDALPPDDYETYYQYIKSMAENLVEVFGLDEVRCWRFGVLVEFENSSWFHSKDMSPSESRDAFFKLYDYSVIALTDVLGKNLYIGAHAMACTEGLWDERELLNHCTTGINAKTGEIGVPISYFAVSFYDDAPDKPHFPSLPETIEHIRARAKEVGLTNLRYGVDEGRILYASPGKDGTDLTWRIVGQTYQVAYDARLFKILIDSDVDYFSSWSYSSSDAWNGYPLLSYRVAEKIAELKNSKQVSVSSEKEVDDGVDCDAIAGFDESTNVLYLMAYNFKFDLNYSDPVNTSFNISVPFWAGKQVEIEETLIDDESNFFCQWLLDKEKFNISDDVFHWSPDSGCLDSGISDLNTRELYFRELRPRYVEIANQTPPTRKYTVQVHEDGVVECSKRLPRHAVVFYSFKVR